MDSEEHKWRPYPVGVDTARANLVNGLFDLRARIAVAVSSADEHHDNRALKELCGAMQQLVQVIGDTFLYSQDALLKEDPGVSSFPPPPRKGA